MKKILFLSMAMVALVLLTFTKINSPSGDAQSSIAAESMGLDVIGDCACWDRVHKPYTNREERTTASGTVYRDANGYPVCDAACEDPGGPCGPCPED